jgi:hypothetical protein
MRENIKKMLSDKGCCDDSIIDIVEDIVRGLLQDIKYISDENKRLNNENLNLKEHIEELEDQIKYLKK